MPDIDPRDLDEAFRARLRELGFDVVGGADDAGRVFVHEIEPPDVQLESLIAAAPVRELGPKPYPPGYLIDPDRRVIAVAEVNVTHVADPEKWADARDSLDFDGWTFALLTLDQEGGGVFYQRADAFALTEIHRA